MSPVVVAVSPEHWDALEALFATSAGVRACACMWPLRAPGTHEPNEARNQAEMRSLIESREATGLIALEGARAVGWCALGPRARYPQYAESAEQTSAWAIPCLYIAPDADRSRVARALIGRAVQLARANDAAALDGPPPWWLPGDAAAVARAAETFLANGFERVGDGARMPELRRRLA